MWIDQICRLCAQVGELLVPIFEKNGEKPRLDLKIKKCLSLMVNEADCKPKQVCYNCATKLEDYYDFLELCQSSDYKFEAILFGSNTNEQTEQESVVISRPRWENEHKEHHISEQLPTQEQQLPHDGVIVVGKMDETQNMTRECQDILFMVELKYKDVDLETQSAEIMKQNKIIYQENDILHDKQLSVYPQGVLRHSDDFAKLPDKTIAQDTQDINLKQLQYQEQQHTYIEQPIELIKNNYTNCIQENPKATKTKPFPCSQCNKSFMRRSNLNAHMSTHTQVRPYHCEQCDRSFALRWNLTVHQRLHTGLYSCEFCRKAFPVKGKLERHRRTHTGERPFACSIPDCDKAFADKRNLEAHIKTHSTERPYVCSVCGRGFRSRSHLTDHQRVHSAEAPFTCDSCGKSFKWKTNLTIHLKMHSGEKSVCSDCGKQFARPTQLMKHKKVHHADSSQISKKVTS